MTSPKPDYLIAANGLPNILNTRHMIRQTQNRMQPKDSKSLRKSSSVNKCHKDKRNFMNISKAPATVLDRNKLNISTKSQKDLINEEIKSTNSHRCDISSSTFLSTSSQKIEADNKCNSLNIERYEKGLDNKYTHQRKYDNKIFRHDLPDRIVLPPLPI